MDAMSLMEAKTHLSELVSRAEAGHSINITRRGKAVARLTPIARPRKPIDAVLLRSLTTTMWGETEWGTDAFNAIRDGDRY